LLGYREHRRVEGETGKRLIDVRLQQFERSVNTINRQRTRSQRIRSTYNFSTVSLSSLKVGRLLLRAVIESVNDWGS
jgi:50S ribosomal subunit-associated GTPase HflX